MKVRNLLAGALLLLAAPFAAQAQGYHWVDHPVLNQAGQPVGGAVVTVCLSSATPTQCAAGINKVTIYSDQALTMVAANPTTADNRGNYNFYVNSGVYLLSISGPSVTTYPELITLGCLPSSSVSGCGAGGGGGSPVGSNGDVQVKASATTFGSGVASTANVGVLGNIAVKSFAADGVLYVSPSGSDSNDGRSPGTAKQYIDKALEALPGGDGSTTAGSGTVYVATQTQPCAASAADGIWLMGNNDPGYSVPPTCWVKVSNNAGQGITIIGIPAANGLVPSAYLSQTTNSNRNIPEIWLSSTTESIQISNLIDEYQGRGVVIGECSNNDRTGTCNASNVHMTNVNPTINLVAGMGPSWDITGDSFWVWINGTTAEGSAYDGTGAVLNGLSSNLSPCILIDGTTNAGVGLVFISDVICTNWGGIKVTPGSNPSGMISVDHFTEEGEFSGGQVGMPGVWVTNTMGGSFQFKNIELADVHGTTPAVQVDAEGSPNDVTVDGACGQNENVVGSMTVLSSCSVDGFQFGNNPLVEQQIGFINNRVLGQTDVARRQFPPVPVRYANVVLSPGSWANFGTCSNGNGAEAPDQSGLSTRTSCTSGSQDFIRAYDTNHTSAPGDWYYVGLWEEAPTGAFTGGDRPVQINLESCTATVTESYNFPFVTQTLPVTPGGWQWVYGYAKVATVTGNPCEALVFVGAQSGVPTDTYGLVVNYIPAASALSDQEMVDYFNNLSSYANSCVVGTNCGMPVPLAGYASLNLYNSGFFGTLTPATLSAARTWTLPNVTGIIPIISGAITPGDCGQWVTAVTLGDAGAPCGAGGGGGPTLQTNTVNNTSQALLNFLNSTTNSVGLTITASNPSGGVEKLEITGGSYTGNAATATSAATWTTARSLAGNSVNGSVNVPFTNKFVAEGTSDTGLTGAQFLGALATGIVKVTTTTGALTTAIAGDFPTLNQNTSGTAANLSGTPALPNGTTATTQTLGDNTTKIATDAFVLANAAGVTGLTTGFFPKAASSTTLTNTLCDEAITTPNTITCTDTAGFVAVEFTTSATNGGISGTEGTGAALSAGSGTDLLYPDSSSHCWHQNVNNSDVGCTAAASNTLTMSNKTFVAPVLGAATATSLLATGIVDGEAPITITTGSSANLGGTYRSGYTLNQEATAGTGVTYTLPATSTGMQYCVRNSGTTGVINIGVLTVYPPSSSFVILNGVVNTVGGGGTHGVASSGAAGDAACFVAIDSTHWEVWPVSGTWAEN